MVDGLNGHHRVDGMREIHGDPLTKPLPPIVAPCRDPPGLMAGTDAVVGILVLRGPTSEWVGDDLWQRGATVDELPRDGVVPSIRDRVIRMAGS